MDTAVEVKDGHVNIDMKQLMSVYEPYKPMGEFILSSGSCIFKTPSILSRHNKKAYLPNAFSFGPWHYEEPHLMASQPIKYKYLEDRLRRFPDPDKKLAELEAAIAEVEDKARQCYAGDVGVSKDEFVKLLVLDGCFIVELFSRYPEGAYRHLDASGVPNKDGGDPDEGKHPDPVFSVACMRQFLLHDLILLENQIPWFVLERLFNLTNSNASAPLLEIALLFFMDHYLTEGVPSEKSLIDNWENHHIISLLRNCMILKKKEDTSNLHSAEFVNLFPARKYRQWLLERPLPSARKLKESGIKFERAKGRSILDIRFERGVLKIPRLFIHETTETLFRNIISFEQCYPGCSSEFTCYVKFMDSLIDKDEDIKVLIKKDVIYTWLEPEAAMEILNKLYQDAFFDDSFYADQCQQVKNYYFHWWPTWRAYFVRNYFTRPWAVFSQIFAFLVLFVSILDLVLKK